MATIFTVRTPNRQDLTLVLEQPLVLGRECDGLIIDDQRVSRRHVRLEPVGEEIRIEDLGSSNGTELNGQRLTQAAMAAPGDRITLGDTTLYVAAGAGTTASRPTLHTEIAPAAHTPLMTSIEMVAEAVVEDTPLAQVVGAQDEAGTLTIVFSDIESSTTQALAMGDTAWMAVLQEHHQLVEAHVGAHQGRIIKNQGDGYMLCFRSARQAVLASIGIQRDLDRLHGETSEIPVRVRIGMHTGEVLMQDDGDIFGKHVIVAARVGALASGGQILVSSLVKQIAEPRGDLPFGPAVEVELKGIAGTSVVHDVDWAQWSVGSLTDS